MIADSTAIRTLDDLDHALWAIRKYFDEYGPMEAHFNPIGAAQSRRSIAQNKLAFRWYEHIAKSMQDGTTQDKRAYCKLHYGVAIRKEDEVFREKYDRIIRPLPYEHKLEVMVDPIDFPVTRDMSIKDMSRYLDAMQQGFAKEGIILPTQDDLYLEAMGLKRTK